MPAVMVYVTAASNDEATRIAKTIVTERLAACANILADVTSLFCWQDELQTERETAMILKTESRLVAPLVARIKELHSYDCPCVVAMPIIDGNPVFLDWIMQETAD